MPVAKRDFAIISAARHASRPAVLLASANQIREAARCRPMKHLARGLVVPGAPRLPGVHTDQRALIADEQNDAWKVRIDPKILIIISARRAATAGPGCSAVCRAHRNCTGAISE